MLHIIERIPGISNLFTILWNRFAKLFRLAIACRKYLYDFINAIYAGKVPQHGLHNVLDTS